MKKSNQKSNPAIHLGMVLLGILVVVALAVISTPVILKSEKYADMTQATSNAKQVFYQMVDFDQDYGEFPGDATAVLHSGKGRAPGVNLSSFKGKHSNDYMGQLIAAGYVKEESLFVAPWEKNAGRKADNSISPRERILEAGECNFSYIKNQSTANNSGRPILLAPMTGEGFTFNPDVYRGKAVVLRIDGSVRSFLIDNKSHLAKIGGGKTMFEGGQDTVWGVEGFDPENLVHPKPWLRHLKDSWGIKIGIVVAVVLAVVVICITRSRRKKKGLSRAKG